MNRSNPAIPSAPRCRACRALPALAVLVAATAARAQTNDQYDLTWYSINGGGQTTSTTEGYELGNTIGQVGAEIMVGADYTLIGGYWAGVCDQPAFVVQPIGETVCQYAGVTFTSSVVGTPDLLYQWRHNGADLPGETNDTLTIDVALVDHAGDYELIVTNECGTAVSTVITLTVNTEPVVTLPPASLSVCAGSPAAFSVTAEGAAPISYQWRWNGRNIIGATDPNLTIESTQATDAGIYDVVVFNDCGLTLSDAAVLDVWAAALGDLDADGFIDGEDIAGFIDVLMNSPTGPVSLGFCGADMDHSGTVDEADLTLFVNLLLGL